MNAQYRARADEQKQQRREEILAAAGRLFEQHPYSSVTMAQVAQEAGLAKGTTYLYFRTKEQLFLEMLGEQLGGWLDGMCDLLEQLPEPLPPEELGQLVAQGAMTQPRLMRLMTLVYGVFEQNIDEDTARAFKLTAFRGLQRAGRILEGHYPQLQPGDGYRFLVMTECLLIRLYEIAHPSEVVERILDEPELQPLRIEFQRELAFSMATLLRGWQS